MLTVGGIVYSKKSDIYFVAKTLVTHFSGKVKSFKILMWCIAPCSPVGDSRPVKIDNLH